MKTKAELLTDPAQRALRVGFKHLVITNAGSRSKKLCQKAKICMIGDFCGTARLITEYYNGVNEQRRQSFNNANIYCEW